MSLISTQFLVLLSFPIPVLSNFTTVSSPFFSLPLFLFLPSSTFLSIIFPYISLQLLYLPFPFIPSPCIPFASPCHSLSRHANRKSLRSHPITPQLPSPPQPTPPHPIPHAHCLPSRTGWRASLGFYVDTWRLSSGGGEKMLIGWGAA